MDRRIVTIELSGYFAEKTGRDTIEIEYVFGNVVTLLEIMQRLERELIDRDIIVLNADRLKPGVLIFRRNIQGGTERIFDLKFILGEQDDRYVLATLMGGG